MRVIVFFLFNVILLFNSSAQNGIPPHAGARGMAMGGTGVIFQDAYSLFGNQAGMAHLKELSVVAFAERRFSSVGINGAAAGVAYPMGNGTFGLQFQYFGIDLYNEQKVGLSYARKLMDNLSIGAQFNYLNTKIKDYGNKGVVTFEVGFLATVTKEITLGAHIYSPMRVELIQDENLPTILKFGGAYRPSKKVMLTVEAEKDIDFDLMIKGGIEYFVHPSVAIRVGGSSHPTLVTFGAGFRLKNGMSIDIASSYHQTLGFSPGFSIHHSFAKK